MVAMLRYEDELVVSKVRSGRGENTWSIRRDCENVGQRLMQKLRDREGSSTQRQDTESTFAKRTKRDQ